MRPSLAFQHVETISNILVSVQLFRLEGVAVTFIVRVLFFRARGGGVLLVRTTMRFAERLRTKFGLILLLATAGCNRSSASIVRTSDSTGGADGPGGAANVIGGTPNAGGATGIGGVLYAGGTTSTGGGLSASGATQTGGAASTGGTTSAGGSASRGGATGLGGVAGTGGVVSVGGSTIVNAGGAGIGGSMIKATGGSSAAAGSVATGGRSSTGGSTTAATGGAATGGLGTGGLWRGPTPASSTAKFPFPQNRQNSNCIYPTAYKNEDVQAVYTAWKNDLVTNQGVGANCTSCFRIRRPAEPGLQVNSTVSEGIGYGMIIAVYMNDQPLFDGLWRYALAHTWSSPNGSTLLMNWYIASDGTVASAADGGQDGSGAATDADEDIAWGLVMADRQWGGKGSLTDKTYLAYAQQLLSDIWTWETINYNLPKNGSSWGDTNCLNISYFAPAYYRVFATVANNAQWLNNAVPYIYQVISQNLNATNGNQNNGLVPGFSTSTGATANCGQYSPVEPHNYQYDACRTPFRIGLDACWNNDPNAVSYVGKTSSFFSTRGGASKIVDGYGLDGTPQPQNANGTYYSQNPSGTLNGLSAAFIGPAAVGAMPVQAGQNYQSFVDGAYNLIRPNDMWCGGQYYDESWTMLSMLMLTGNFLDYTRY